MKTLQEAREYVQERRDAGVRCPCCGQWAKVYRRKINAGAARGLVAMHRASARNWCHVPSTGHLAQLGGEFARLRFWGLVEEEPTVRDDGGRAGWWRMTPLGTAFVYGWVRVPKYIFLFDGQLVRVGTEKEVDINEAMGEPFHLGDLMGEGA